MNIKRFIDQNRKLIFYTIIIIVFSFVAIKSLNAYYEKDEERKKNESTTVEKSSNSNIQSDETKEIDVDKLSTKNNTIEKTMEAFVAYCNNRQIENAYDMLTEESKEAMFPTVDDFERIYIKNVYNIKREYRLVRWSTDGNKYIYHVDLYGDILATGNNDDYTQEYYTFIKNDDGTYKINVNNYIYGEERDIEIIENNIKVEIGRLDVYEEYEKLEITITNKSSKTICLTGNKYVKNIYLQNSQGTAYSSFNSKFDSEVIIMKPNETQTFSVSFNKIYNINNKAVYLVLSDIILDYEDYLNSEDKLNYWNRTSIKTKY